jgi:glycosyltransferase involved in cell wall biosynthesis
MVGLIVHEWYAKTGGSEKVLDQMLEEFSDAHLYVLWNDRAGTDRRVRESWISRTPLRRNKALALPFQIPLWRRLSGEAKYDWMLVSSHLFAHHARLRDQPGIPKYVYAHTPARYIWAPELDRRGAAWHVRAASSVLRPIDRRRAAEAHSIAANSQFTRERIQKTWGRDAHVIYPPVDVQRILSVEDWSSSLSESEQEVLNSLPEGFLLGASRMIPYKRLDAVIQAGEATHSPVVLAGDGPLWDELCRQASAAEIPVMMIRQPSDRMLFALYQRARALVFPAVEDFGIMPVEAMAAGCPVIAPTLGGAAESVSLVGGGATVREFTPDQWRLALTSTDTIDRIAVRGRTARFSHASFRSELRRWVTESHAQVLGPPHDGSNKLQ